MLNIEESNWRPLKPSCQVLLSSVCHHRFGKIQSSAGYLVVGCKASDVCNLGTKSRT